MQELLEKWNIKVDYNILLSMWNESHRSYHTQNHLLDLIEQINEQKSKLSQTQYEKLVLCALFHDIVYDPKRGDNEEKSAEFFINCCSEKDNIDLLEVKQMILDTKTHESQTNLSQLFIHFDMKVVESDYEKLLEWEKGIKNEFEPIYGKDQYKFGRLHFLESLLDKYPQNTDNLLKLIDYVKNS
jgi:predicted metal-dependent HD superfamily phosphohydrolase